MNVFLCECAALLYWRMSNHLLKFSLWCVELVFSYTIFVISWKSVLCRYWGVFCVHFSATQSKTFWIPCKDIAHWFTMHCTSPGNGANAKMHEVDVTKDINGLMQTEIQFDGTTDKIYDDPCDLDVDWSSPIRLPRSRSWLCCPRNNNGATTDTVNLPRLQRRYVSCDYALVTEEPRPRPNANNVINRECSYFLK